MSNYVMLPPILFYNKLIAISLTFTADGVINSRILLTITKLYRIKMNYGVQADKALKWIRIRFGLGIRVSDIDRCLRAYRNRNLHGIPPISRREWS